MKTYLYYDMTEHYAILEEGQENTPLTASPFSHLNELVKGK